MSDGTDDAVVIERTLAAPPALVWRMWTDPEHFAAWYGPAGASIPVAELDVRVDGRRRVCMEMTTPNGPMQMWFAGVHREVDEPHRLVYTESMTDEAGNVLTPAAMGMPDGHPTTTEVTVELAAIDGGTADGGTRMTLTHAGVPADSPGATGWAMALDKLEAHVASLP